MVKKHEHERYLDWQVVLVCCLLISGLISFLFYLGGDSELDELEERIQKLERILEQDCAMVLNYDIEDFWNKGEGVTYPDDFHEECKFRWEEYSSDITGRTPVFEVAIWNRTMSEEEMEEYLK